MADVLAVRDEYRAQMWTGLIQECKASGMTNKDFCTQRGISEKSFYYWQRKFREQVVEAATPQLVQLEAVSAPTELLQISFRGAELKLPAQVDMDAVAVLLRPPVFFVAINSPPCCIVISLECTSFFCSVICVNHQICAILRCKVGRFHRGFIAKYLLQSTKRFLNAPFRLALCFTRVSNSTEHNFLSASGAVYHTFWMIHLLIKGFPLFYTVISSHKLSSYNIL